MPIETIKEILDNKHISRDLDDLLYAFQEVFDEMMEDINNFVDIIDPDLCDEKFLDSMFYEMGFRLFEDIQLGTTQKRKLVKSLITLYSQKGTESGLKNALWSLMNINTTLRSKWRDDCFTLGVSELQNNTELAPEKKPHKYHYTTEIHLDQEVSDQERDLIEKIVEFVIEKHLRYKIYEPGEDEEDTLSNWMLGQSQLGWNFETVLHE